jgi:hypothetical protein
MEHSYFQFKMQFFEHEMLMRAKDSRTSNEYVATFHYEVIGVERVNSVFYFKRFFSGHPNYLMEVALSEEKKKLEIFFRSYYFDAPTKTMNLTKQLFVTLLQV